MNPIEFARNLFLLRRANRMTIEELAQAMEVTPEVVCAWECAKTSPSLDQMNRLAKVYGVPLAEIIRNPKPMDEIPEPAPEEKPFAEDLATDAEAPEEAPIPEPESAEPRRGRTKKVLWWEIAIIVLLLAIIGASLTFLIKPEWFPLVQWLGK